MKGPDLPPPGVSLAHTLTEPSLRTGLRTDLRRVIVAWMFGSVWLYTITGAAMTQFARGLGVTDAGFGLLAALPHMAALVQLPASFFLETGGNRKSRFIIAAAVSRVMWIVAALIPYALAPWPHLWPTALVVVLLVAWTTGQYSGPAWMNWMADLIPSRIRGRYFSLRTRLSVVVGIIVTLGIGLLLDLAQRRAAVDPAMLRRMTSLLIGLAGVIGTIDILIFLRVHDPATHVRSHRFEWIKRIWQPWADPAFRRFAAYNFTLVLGLAFIGQYIWLFALDRLQMSNWQANVVLVAIPLLIHAWAVVIWGRLMDRLGRKPVIVVAGLLFVAGPFGWFIATPESWVLGYVLTLVSPLAWAGVELAGFNILLSMSSASGRGPARRDGGSAFVAWNSLGVAIAGTISGLLAGRMAGTFQYWEYAAPWGVDLSYHHLLFIASSALRLVAVVLALSLYEPAAIATRDAIRYMTFGVWFNARQALLMPMRMAGRVSRWTYRLSAELREPRSRG
jgi:MFS family permease